MEEGRRGLAQVVGFHRRRDLSRQQAHGGAGARGAGEPRARCGRGLRRAVAHRGGCGGSRGQGRGHRHLSRDAGLRPRARTVAGLENVEFVESEAASLDFSPESFDAALSRFGIIFEPEAEAAAARVRGFLVPGSRMVISSWGPPERVPFIALPMVTAMRTLGVDPPPPGTPGPLSRPTPEALGGCSRAAGSPMSRSRRPRSASSGSPPTNSSRWSRTRSHRWSR